MLEARTLRIHLGHESSIKFSYDLNGCVETIDISFKRIIDSRTTFLDYTKSRGMTKYKIHEAGTVFSASYEGDSESDFLRALSKEQVKIYLRLL